MIIRRFVAPAMLGAICVSANTSYAVDLAYEASVGGGYSDNITRVAQDEIDETIAMAGLKFSLSQTQRFLTADILGDLAYYDYLDDTYQSEFLGNLIGDVRLHFVPERFEWVITDNFGQTLDDPFAPATPDNRENLNYFNTGPDLTLGFGSQTRLRVGGRYGLVTYEDRPLDSEILSVEAALIRNLSSSSNVGLNARVQEVKYDDIPDADYDQRDAYISYDVLGARTQLGIDVGYSEIELDAADEADDGLLLRLELIRRLTRSSTASLRAGREFANSGSAFVSAQNSAPIGSSPIPAQQTAQPFTNDFVYVDWRFSRNRTDVGFYASWNDQSYESNAVADQTLTGFGFDIGRELSQTTSLALSLQRTSGESDIQAPAPSADYDENSAILTFRWQLSERTSINANYRYTDRSAESSEGEYTENRFFISFSYGRGRPRTTALSPFPTSEGA